MLIGGANVSVRMALYAMKFEKGEEEMDMDQLLMNIISQHQHNPERLERLKDVMDTFFLVPYVQMLAQLLKYLDPKVTLQHLLSDLGWKKLREEQFYNLVWANGNWPRNALQVIRFQFDIFSGDRNYQERNQFELKTMNGEEPDAKVTFGYEEYESIQQQIKESLEKKADPQQSTQTLFKVNLLDTALVTLSTYANYFAQTIPSFYQEWKQCQTKIELTESQGTIS